MEPLEWTEFLESYPPGRAVQVVNAGKSESSMTYPKLLFPDLTLPCDDPTCEGPRKFRGNGEAIFLEPHTKYTFMYYVCRNCRLTSKTYAIGIQGGPEGTTVVKVGEWPPYGPPTPSRVINLIGPDREHFLRGRRSESQGLGIGAYAYYRRVIENQKNRLLDQIIRVTKQTSGDQTIIAQLERAKAETQFTKAIDEVKPGIPDALKIGGMNPLALLHSALSDGIHALSDEDCLQRASDIRIVLTELANRMEQLLEDHTELTQAVNRLANRTSPPPKSPPK